MLAMGGMSLDVPPEYTIPVSEWHYDVTAMVNQKIRSLVIAVSH